MEHTGHRERLRARFAQAGFMGFAPHEALELLLTYAIPRRNVNPLAHQLLNHFGSFPRVLEATAEDLQAVPVMGAHTATLVAMMLPLFRLYRQSLVDEKSRGSNTDLLALCQALLMGEKMERFHVLALDKKGKLLGHSCVSSGDDGETAVYPRIIVQVLLRFGAGACVLAHNHPSGELRPSQADIRLTKALAQMIQPLDITLSDHVIVGGDEVFSFAREGLLSQDFVGEHG
ncbi:MAG: DNA repair protein RadC [Eubacteriales bacterium]|nr:DNA repair protein RadC [Eubacteriales bacterium]